MYLYVTYHPKSLVHGTVAFLFNLCRVFSWQRWLCRAVPYLPCKLQSHDVLYWLREGNAGKKLSQNCMFFCAVWLVSCVLVSCVLRGDTLW